MGRPIGAKNKLKNATAEYAIKLKGETPAQFLERVMRGNSEKNPLPKELQGGEMQVEAAKALMPFCHRKQPEARELTHKQDPANPALAIAALKNLMGF